MQSDFQVESRSYEQVVRGSWQAYKLQTVARLTDEVVAEAANDCIRLWLPAGTMMNWSTGKRPLRYHCIQFFWPERWYMLSAFYNGQTLRHIYANIIQPAAIELTKLAYVDLDLSILVNPDLTYEVLTQAEFEHMADLMHYDEGTRISALMATRSLTNSIQLGFGLFSVIPHTLSQTEFHLSSCAGK